MEKLNPKRIPLRDSPAQGDPSKGINWSEPGLCKCCPWDVTAAFYCNSHQERLDFNYTHNKTAIWTEMVAAPIVFTEQLGHIVTHFLDECEDKLFAGFHPGTVISLLVFTWHAQQNPALALVA